MNKIINSHTNWGRLQEVWLGDVYPAAWYDHLQPEVRDCFQEITEKTQQDLAVIQQCLEGFGVQVRRPQYTCIDDYMRDDILIKPHITPRDDFVVIGNTLYGLQRTTSPWQHILDEYRAAGEDVQYRMINGPLNINGANVVRVGRDIYIDLMWEAQALGSNDILVNRFRNVFAHCFKDYRVHLVFNGGHIDGCFAVLQPGLLIASRYFENYNETFPGWARIDTSQPEFHNHTPNLTNVPDFQKWYVPGTQLNRVFNQHVIDHALSWVGNYTETFFEINCLVIDEKNVLVMGEHPAVFQELERHGITPHPVPFRTRTFWDGGVHCLTLDIRRDDTAVDLFPDRGAPGIDILQ